MPAHNQPRTFFRKTAVIVALALVGWVHCAALIGIGRYFIPMRDVLVMHAIGAPVGFAVISFVYFKKFAFTTPLQTAFLFLGIIMTLDLFVVAIFIEKSLAMFASPLGKWLPLALIFGATYVTGRLCRSP